MEGVEIRLACEEDTPALAALITELGFPTNPAEMASRLARIRGRSNCATLVAAANGILVGMAGLSVSPSFLSDTLDAQIIAFVVADGQRGRGIGRALLARRKPGSRNEARSESASPAACTVPGRTPSIAPAATSTPDFASCA